MIVKNVRVYSKYKFIKKQKIHTLISVLCDELQLIVSSLDVDFVSGSRIKNINSEYLDHNYTTDIITFNYSGSTTNLDGEIFISVDDAEENAKKFKVKLSEELTRLVIHGILHLAGYDDHKKNDKIKMKRLENKLLNTLKFILL